MHNSFGGSKFFKLFPVGVGVLTACLAGCVHETEDKKVALAPPPSLACDDSIKTAFKPDANTTVLTVKSFKKGEPLVLPGSQNPQAPQTFPAANDICLVKLNVGPGNPGPADAPSTSAGIGIELWLPTPENWNKRLHANGGGGWQGGAHGSVTQIAEPNLAAIAGVEGAIAAANDSGHALFQNGSFAMNPDGSINTTLWVDYASRANHEMAVKAKALALAYYGSAPKYSYLDGFSGGGRQGMKAAQIHPEDFDGILAGAPAFNFTRFITADLYPQIVFQRDLAGRPLTKEQQDLVSNAAIAACDNVAGQHLGYIVDPSTCHYDPTKDRAVLCRASGGTNTSPHCVSTAQARAVNKIWFGITADGSAPAPATDNGWKQAFAGELPAGKQRWFGFARGTSLYAAAFSGFGVNGPASPVNPFYIATDVTALELQNAAIAQPAFTNATGNGNDGWRQLGYAELSKAFDKGVALQPQFGQIDSDSADLAAFKARGGKMLHYHGLADEMIPPQGSVNYYHRVIAAQGGLETVQSFYRLFMIPAVGHGVPYFPNGTSNPNANPPTPAPDQLYNALTDWVEKGVGPDSIPLQSMSDKPIAKSQPICAYPAKATYKGSGDPFAAASYQCL